MLEEAKKQKPRHTQWKQEHQLSRKQNSLKAELTASSDQALSQLLGYNPTLEPKSLRCNLDPSLDSGFPIHQYQVHVN